MTWRDNWKVINVIVLVIPDVHLKPWMFQRASERIKEMKLDRAVCLMDIADDWGQELNLNLYGQTYDAAIAFAKEHPDTLWCWGNHDLSYLWNEMESGFSFSARSTVLGCLERFRKTVPSKQLRYIHRIDDILFLHGGLTEDFVRRFVCGRRYDEIDTVLEKINRLARYEMWDNSSPIWYRPQLSRVRMYKPRKLLQVVGHTPVREVCRDRNILSCDTFSTNRDGTAFGSQKFTLIDTVSRNWEEV